MDYGFHATLHGRFEPTVQRVVDALKEEGFGVLSDIDMSTSVEI